MITVNLPVRSLLFVLALLVCAAAIGNAQQPRQDPKAATSAGEPKEEAAPVVQMTLEPKAMALLKAACDRLAAARTMRFTAVVSYESPSLLGTPLVYTTKSEVTLQRPDKLRVMTPGDGPATEFYYDGKMMTAFAPAENLVAVAEAPPTIDATLQAAYDIAAIYFPFTDVIVADPYKDIVDGLILAFYIGQSHVVGGTTTDMVAYADNDVFIQIWIGAEDKLPRMLRAVYRRDPARLRHQLALSDWQLNLSVPEDTFASTRAGSAKPIAFAHPNPHPAPDAKTPVQRKSSTRKGSAK